MTYYVRHGSHVHVTSHHAMMLPEETLAPATYTVGYDMMTESYYLAMVEGFDVNHKIYGDTMDNTERILNTFKSRENSTGVMLSGEKGSGKTLLAKMLSVRGQEMDIPTIVINHPWNGEGFNTFIQSIDQPVIILFDEFEKVYDAQEQERLLTLLDGVYPSKKLFVLTCNDKYRVNEHMKNRPGRIFYRLEFTGLDNDFIVEYCKDKLDVSLQELGYIDTISRIAVMFTRFNFDILKALVEEMNRYQESPQQAMRMLNAKPEGEDNGKFKVELLVEDKKIEGDDLHTSEWRGNPLGGEIGVFYYKDRPEGYQKSEDEDEDDNREWVVAKFNVGDFKGVDPESGTFKFSNPQNENLSLSRVAAVKFSYYDAL